MTPELSVIVPAYNEAQRIEPTLRDIDAWLSRRGLAREILVVDDGSTDDTRALVDRLASEIEDLSAISTVSNRGKGHAVRAGMLSARGRLRLFMDADNATPISEMPRLLEAIEAGADIAIGSRRAPGARLERKPPWYRRMWSYATNRVVQATLVSGIADTQCGFKLFSQAAADAIFPQLRTLGWGFDLEVLARARALGLSIAECPVVWTDDRRTRVRPLLDAVRISVEFVSILRAVRGQR